VSCSPPAADPGVPERRSCDRLRWLDGRFVDDAVTTAYLRQVGILMGWLQQHGAQLPRTDGFERGLVDHVTRFGRTQKDNLSLDVAAHAAALVTDVHSVRGGPIVRAVIDLARQAREKIGRWPDTFGLVHADLHQENFLFRGREIRSSTSMTAVTACSSTISR
jgi:Ser/Thr protein kinase RdoA (MazF antagonist)